MKYHCKIIELSQTIETHYPITDDPVGPGKWPRLLTCSGHDLIVASDQLVARVNAAGSCLWAKPLVCSGRPLEAFISDDRLLITTSSNEYHVWGHLGPAILINLKNGSLIKELRGSKGTALQGGYFLLGLEGYDVFNTWLYDRNGILVQEWRSYGHYLIGQGELIWVIEQDRSAPTNSCVVQLQMNGSIKKGPKLLDGTASPPIVIDNGVIVFVDAGVLRAVDCELKDQVLINLLPIPSADIWRFTANLSIDKGEIKIEIIERSADMPIIYIKHNWLIQLKNLDLH